MEKVAVRLFELHKDYLSKTKIYDECVDEFENTSKEINLKRLALDAFIELVTMFEDQIKVQETFQKVAQPHEVRCLVENVAILSSRLKSLNDTRMQLEESLKQRVAYNRSIEREMLSLKPVVIQLFRQKEKYTMWLTSHGVNPAHLAQILKSGGVDIGRLEGDEEYPHRDESTWMLPLCSRKDAERYLAGCKDGTFLVRPSRTGQHALSIICNGAIGHCIIYATRRGYGFAEPYNIYPSIMALVLHYAQNSLEQHNDSLTTTLAIPVLAPGGSEVAIYELKKSDLQIPPSSSNAASNDEVGRRDDESGGDVKNEPNSSVNGSGYVPFVKK